MKLVFSVVRPPEVMRFRPGLDDVCPVREGIQLRLPQSWIRKHRCALRGRQVRGHDQLGALGDHREHSEAGPSVQKDLSQTG
jgi:hypothetical protein